MPTVMRTTPIASRFSASLSFLTNLLASRIKMPATMFQIDWTMLHTPIMYPPISRLKPKNLSTFTFILCSDIDGIAKFTKFGNFNIVEPECWKWNGYLNFFHRWLLLNSVYKDHNLWFRNLLNDLNLSIQHFFDFFFSLFWYSILEIWKQCDHHERVYPLYDEVFQCKRRKIFQWTNRTNGEPSQWEKKSKLQPKPCTACNCRCTNILVSPVEKTIFSVGIFLNSR